MKKIDDEVCFFENNDTNNEDAGLYVATNGGFGMASIDLPVFIDWLRANYPKYLEDKNVATTQDKC